MMAKQAFHRRRSVQYQRNRSAVRARQMFGPLLAVSLGVFALGGCPIAGPNTLEGSISETFALEFDRTEMRKFSSGALQLDYLKDLEGSDLPEIICKVVFDSPDDGISSGEDIDIVAQNGVIERRASDGVDFPALESGTITFSTGGNEAGAVAGRFTSLFDTGKTLNGDFDTELVEVDF